MNRIILTLAAVTLAAVTLAAPCWGQETRSILKGATDQSVYIRIVDSADGTPETGVTSATAGLDLEYVRNRAAAADLTESDLAAVDSAHSDGGIKHVGNGVYRVDLPDAACATGVDGVLVTGTATDMVVIPARIQLTGFDLQTATQAVNVTTWSGTAVATPDTAGYPKVTIKDGTGTGEIDTTSGGVALSAGQEIEVADADLRAALGMAAADLDTQLDAIVADTNELQTDWANGGRLDVLIDAIKAATDLLNSAQAEPTGVPAANETPLDKLAYVFMMLRNQVTVTADNKTYHDDAGNAEFKKGLTDNGTTYTEAEAAAP